MFIVVDVEADGAYVGDYSMVSFGAVAVDKDLNKTFYGKVKPISDKWNPEALAVSMELARLDVERSADRVNSKDVTIDLWINAMRTEGVRTQILTTTI